MLFKFRDFMTKVSTILGWVSCIAVVVVAVFIFVSVILRYIFKIPIVGSTEIVECMMAVMVFACLAYTQSYKGHISISMLLRLFPKKLAGVIHAIGLLLATVFCAYASYSLLLQGNYAGKKHLQTALVHIPYQPFYYVAFVCMVVFTIVFLADMLIAFAGIGDNKYREFVREDWV